MKKTLYFHKTKEKYFTEIKCSCGGFVKLAILKRGFKQGDCYPHSMKDKRRNHNGRYISLRVEIE